MKGRAFCNLISEGMSYRLCCTILYIRYKQLGPVHAQGGGEYKRHTSHIRSKIPKRWMGLPGGSIVKNPPANAGHARDTGLIPGSGRSPGGGNGNPLQYPWLESSTDRREVWQATVCGVGKALDVTEGHACRGLAAGGRGEYQQAVILEAIPEPSNHRHRHGSLRDKPRGSQLLRYELELWSSR